MTLPTLLLAAFQGTHTTPIHLSAKRRNMRLAPLLQIRKRTFAMSRMGNAGAAFCKQRKKKYKAMRDNARAYQKSLFDDAKTESDAKPEHRRVKPHELRKQVRMPLSIAAGSDDFKPAFESCGFGKVWCGSRRGHHCGSGK